MRQKKGRLCILTLLLLISALTCSGCRKQEEQNSDYYIYYVDKDWTHTVARGYEVQSSSLRDITAELLQKLAENTDSPDYRKAMPGDVKVNDWKLENGQMYLYFNSDYAEMDNVTEVLCRAAIVRTLIQVEGVNYISFYVGDTPLTDENGSIIGLMTADSFIENPGEQINSIQTADITLYFANKEGTKLVEEVQEDVRYSSNISMEKLVMEHLLKGPESKELRSAIPSGTKLVSVSVLDGVCFVNLNEGFLNQDYEINEQIVIYSIVNSLAELPNVNKVQIAVNGDSNLFYREEYDLGRIYERNLDCIEQDPVAEEQTQEQPGSPEGEETEEKHD